MASPLSLRASYQDWVALVCAVLLFVAPWILGFSGDVAATRAAWITGVVVALFAAAALVQFAEWEEWVNGLLGVWMIVAPWIVGFATVGVAVAAFVVLGIVVLAAAASELWQVHHPQAMAH